MSATKSTLTLVVGGEDLDQETIYMQARALRRILQENLENSEVLDAPKEQAVTGTKGDPVTIATIILAMFSSGSVVALIGCFKSIFVREKSLSVSVTDSSGRQVKIDSKNVDDDKVVKLLEELTTK